jgi:hypothetical protein
MEAIEFIFKLALFIFGLISFGYILNFIMSIISKGFGTTSTLNGNVVSTPDDYDWHIQNIKDAKKFITDNVKKYANKVNSGKKIDSSEKILLLEKLEELKNNNTISIEEYNDLRNKLLNN